MRDISPPIRSHPRTKFCIASWPALVRIVAVHVPSLGVAVMPTTVEGLHVDRKCIPTCVGGVVVVTVVLPLGQVVTVTVQAELLILFVLSAPFVQS